MRKIWIVGSFISFLPCIYGQSVFNFDSPAGGPFPWQTSTNWTPNGVPDTGTQASITFPGSTSYTVSINGDADVCEGLTLAGSGILAITSGSLTVGSSGLSATSAGPLINFPNTGPSSNQTLTLNGTSTFAGTLSGFGTCNLASGSFGISGTCNFTGPTNLNEGTLTATSHTALSPNSQYVFADASTAVLTLGANNTMGSLTGNGGTIDLNGHRLTVGADGTFPGAYAGVIADGSSAGNLAVSGGTLSLSGVNTYTGTTTVNGGNLTVTGTLVNSGVTNITAGTLTANSSTALSPNSQYVFTNALTALLILGDNNTMGSLTGGGTNGGNISLNGYTLTVGADGTTPSPYVGAISGSGNLTIIGGRLILSGNNSYIGTTYLNGGILNANSITALSPTSQYSFGNPSSALLNINSNNTIDSLTGGSSGSSVSLNGYTLTISNGGTYGGAISGSGGLTISGGALSLGGNNTYTGTTTLYGATLTATSSTALSPNSDYAFSSSSALLTLGADNTMGSLAGTDGTINLAGYTLTVGADGNSPGQYNGTITGSGNLTVSGGTLTLASTNTYTGSTTVTGGTLSVRGTLQNTAPTYLNGGTLVAASTTALSPYSQYTFGTGSNATLTVNYSNTIGSLTGGIAGDMISINNAGTEETTLTVGADGTSPMNPYAGVISGTGNLAVSGGTLSLSGTNTYTGETTLNGGNLTVTGTLVNLGDTNITSGTLTATSHTALSPYSRYVFADALTAVLTLGDDNTMGSLTGDGGTIYLNGYTLTVGADGTSPVAYAGVIAGTGNLAVSGGTLSLSGNNTYTGEITLNGGNLTVTGTLLNSGVTNITAGTLTANSSTALSPNSRYVFADAQTALLILGANNTMGSLTGGGTAGGNISLNGYTLTVGADGTSPSPYVGAISGSGNLTVSGGTLSLSGNNSYMGTTYLNGGILNANSITALSPTSQYSFGNPSGALLNINSDSTIGSLTGGSSGSSVSLNGSTLTVGADGMSPAPYAGAITGSGNLTVSGGTLSLSGSSNYTGTTIVNGSTLELFAATVNGTSSVTVNNGGILKGTGTITSSEVTISDGCTISPGNSIGTLTISGNLILNSGSQTVIEVNAAGDHSSIAVVGTPPLGTATLAGTLFIQLDEGSYATPTIYTNILTANTLNGIFNSVVAYGFKALVSYPGNDSVKVTLFPINLHQISLTGNAKAVASYLISLRFLPFMQPVLLDLYELSDPQLLAALNAISPSRNSFSTFAAANTNFTITNTLSDRLASQRRIHLMQERNPALAASLFLTQNTELTEPEEALPLGSSQTLAKEGFKYDVWIEGLGEFAHQNAISQNPDFNFNTRGALFGFDCMGCRGQIGAAIGYAYTGINDGSNAGNATVQFVAASLYGNAYFDKGYLELALLSGYNHYTNDRHIFFPGFDAHAKSSHDGSSCTPRIAGGYDFTFDWATIEPFASVDCAFIFQNKFDEYGAAPLSMKQSRSMSELLRTEIGAHFYEDWMWESWAIILKEKLSYICQKGFGLGTLSRMAILGAPDGLTVTTFTSAQHLFSPALELFMKWEDRWFFSVNYEGEFGSGYTTNEVSGKLGYYF